MNVATNNKAARDAWYRDQVHSAIGVWSTRDADPDRDFTRLMDRFQIVSSDVQVPAVGWWTPKQNDRFSELAKRAWAREVQRDPALEIPGFAAWISAILNHVDPMLPAGVPESSFRTYKFERVMAHLAICANDSFWIARTAEACERRMRFLIQERMAEVSFLTGCQYDWEYCRSIYAHMNLPTTIDEANVEWLFKVFQALDTHVRRLRQRPQEAVVQPPF